VEIHYAGLSFTAPERVQFRHRLEGFERDWRDVGGERSAVFHGLPPGRYRFHVLAANNDGVWNEAGASLAFIVRPELWQTAWFRAGLGLVVAGIVFALVRGRIVRLQRQQAAQREFSRGLITSQEAERKRIAAELHDSLGQNLLVIKNRAVMAKNPGASPAQELEEIARLAAQSIEEVREISQNLRPYQLDRLGLTRALHGLVKKVGASGPLQCVADITPVDRVFATEAETNLFRIVQEALNNVLKHSGATEARVVVERDDACVRLRIEDNGRGFEWPLKHADSAHGMGLGGILERVRILDGQLEIDTAPGRGTKLSVEVPVPEEAK
jgi:signal transduction histidine kinase